MFQILLRWLIGPQLERAFAAHRYELHIARVAAVYWARRAAQQEHGHNQVVAEVALKMTELERATEMLRNALKAKDFEHQQELVRVTQEAWSNVALLVVAAGGEVTCVPDAQTWVIDRDINPDQSVTYRASLPH